MPRNTSHTSQCDSDSGSPTTLLKLKSELKSLKLWKEQEVKRQLENEAMEAKLLQEVRDYREMKERLIREKQKKRKTQKP